MGLNDAEEMLAAAQAQSVIDERRIASLERRLAAVRRTIATSTQTLRLPSRVLFGVVAVWDLEQVLDAPDDHDTPL